MNPHFADDEVVLDALLEEIFVRFHYDFRHYARASLRRRLERARIALHCQNLRDLRETLARTPALFDHVLQMLTVQVSDMFRDPVYYRVLREEIAPILRTYPSLKIWVAGCSSGEEVYSLAIVLHEEGLLERSVIYATDISTEALRQAEAGVYALDRVPSFTENHRLSGARCSLSEYYTAGYGAALFDRRLIKHVVFSDHSLATDSVFAEVQLVSCRNVLIYFDRALQDRAIGLFKDALCRRGFLGLGARETLHFCQHASAFCELDRASRWYQRC